jgi:hypothetical protein
VTFYILLSTVAILTAVIGCALIWGYDVVRAREIEHDRRTPPVEAELPVGRQHAELEARAAD